MLTFQDQTQRPLGFEGTQHTTLNKQNACRASERDGREGNRLYQRTAQLNSRCRPLPDIRLPHAWLNLPFAFCSRYGECPYGAVSLPSSRRSNIASVELTAAKSRATVSEVNDSRLSVSADLRNSDRVDASRARVCSHQGDMDCRTLSRIAVCQQITRRQYIL